MPLSQTTQSASPSACCGAAKAAAPPAPLAVCWEALRVSSARQTLKTCLTTWDRGLTSLWTRSFVAVVQAALRRLHQQPSWRLAGGQLRPLSRR
jgi:hypothetical protein